MPDSRFAAVADLKTVDYDEESVVFNDATWETHVLNAAAAEVLSMTIEAPRSVQDITQALKPLLDADDAAGAHEHAARIVDELQALGLLAGQGDAAAP